MELELAVSDTIPEPISTRYSGEIEDELRRHLDERERIGQHYDMLAYHMGWLDEDLTENHGPRGKRFRPLLCLLACEAVGGQWRSALPIAAAVEFLHNFSLIHDDIEDRDESRHHRPSLWKLCGEPLAINAGDAMLALSGLVALSIGSKPISCGFQETALELTEGQYLDMSFESRSNVEVPEYLRMIGLKTAALVSYSCRAGALLGGGTDNQTEALTAFGRHFGMSFQMYDDVRGIWAGSDQTGKVEAKDIANRKKSLPVLLAFRRAWGADREALKAFYAGDDGVVASTIATIIEGLGVRESVEEILREHLDQAFSCLDTVPLREPFASHLRALSSGLVERTPAG